MSEQPNQPVDRNINVNINKRKKARLFYELLSYTILFFIFSLVLLSMLESSAEARTFSIHFSWTIPTQLFLGFGIFSFIITLVFIVLLICRSCGQRLDAWVNKPNDRADKIFATWVHPIIWIALNLTYLAALLDSVKRLPPWLQAPAVIVGLLLFVVFLISLFVYTQESRSDGKKKNK